MLRSSFLKKCLIAALLIVAAFIIIRISPRPPILADMKSSRAVYAADGSLLRLTLSEDGYFRLFTPLEEISPSVIEATLLYEDRYFRLHPGVNPAAILRGFWSSYVKKGRVLGASTVTMQLARSTYSIKSNTPNGKLKQIIGAVWLEMRYSKNDILEAYLNSVPYGHNIEGIGAASLVYFDKRAKELTLVEGFTLCVIPQNPAKRLPTNPEGFARLKIARDGLIKEWIKINPEDAAYQTHFDLALSIGRIADLPFVAPHFVEGVLKEDKAETEFFTTLDLEFQQMLQKELNTYVTDMSRLGIKNATALLVDTETMNVLAAVGSADFFDNDIEGQVDGTRALRSPGSLLKPFIYGLAVEQGLIHPHTMLKDSPRRYGIYTPENSDREFMGPLFARDALNYSRNIPAVTLYLSLEKGSFWNLLKSTNIKQLKPEGHYGTSIALGGLEISMEDAARLFAVFNNEGKLYQLNKLADEKLSEPIKLFSPEAAFITRDMMSHNEPSMVDGYFVRLPGRAAWKTGTSYNFRDGWSAGVYGNYVLAIWIGNFNSEPNPAFTGRESSRLFFRILRRLNAIRHIPPVPESIPPMLNVKYVDICAITGELPADFCPRVTPTLFIPGVSPITVSDVFMKIPIDIETGLRACAYDPKTTRWEVYEFWSSDLLKLYEQAGIKRKLPPRYMPGCTIDVVSHRGLAPEITYPQTGVRYDMANAPAGGNELPFAASVSSDAEKVFWFVDNRFVGETPAGAAFFWRAEPGTHYLQVIDNLGRTNSLTFEVI